MPKSPTHTLHPIEKALLGVRAGEWPKLVPGVLLAFSVSVVATWLADFLGIAVMGFQKSPISSIMVAILLGLVVRNVIGVSPSFRPGLTFCLKKVLRLGIILLGIRLSLVHVLQISAEALPVVIIVVALALLGVWQFARRLRLPERLGILTAVGTSICGASAIAATAPCIDASDEECSYAVANITIFGLLAMFLYPFLARTLFAENTLMAGLFLGTSIHETGQVTGAALMYDTNWLAAPPTGGEVAVVTKLVRNALMAVVIPLVSLIYERRIRPDPQRERQGRAFWRYFPGFVLGFVGLAVFRTLGDATAGTGGSALGIWPPSTWSQITAEVAGWAKNLLAVAMAGVGLGTSYQVLKGLGIRPFILGLAAAALVGVISGLLIMVLAPLLGP